MGPYDFPYIYQLTDDLYRVFELFVNTLPA